MKRLFLVLAPIFLFIVRTLAQGVPVNPLIMGQSYHFAHWNSPATGSLAPFDPTAVWPKVTESGTKLIRAGGWQYNIGPNKPVGGQEVYYVSLVDDIRKNGCEPVITLPFLLDQFSRTTTFKKGHVEPAVGTLSFSNAIVTSTTNATNILSLLNAVHKRNVKYVIIGNEPDIDYLWTTDLDHTATTLCPVTCSAQTATQVAANIAGYIKPLADAVRKTPGGNTIKIIGPEYTHCLPAVYDILFTPGNADYIGGISPATGQPYLDYISCHFYGPDFITGNNDYGDPNFYSPTYSSWAPEVSYCNLERYYKANGEPSHVARRFRGALHYMKQKTYDCGRGPGSANPLGFMITELNSGHTNSLSATPTLAVAAATGSDAISMQGAQNLARMYALSMEYGCSAVMMWSVQESANNEDRGYLVGQSGTGSQGAKRPSWFHYKALADYFKGKYYRDEVFAGYAAGTNPATDQISDEAVGTNSNVPNPKWLHKSSAVNTVTLNNTTFNLGDDNQFKAHLKLMCETKAFASMGADIAVMILNQSSATQTAVIRFDGSTNFSAHPSHYKFFSFAMSKPWQEIVFNNATPTSSNAVIEGNSTQVLIFDCSGTLKKRYSFSLSNQAQSYNQYFGNPYTTTLSPSIYYGEVSCSGAACLTASTSCLGNNNLTITAMGTSGPCTWEKLNSSTNSNTITGQIAATLGGTTYTVLPGIYKTVIQPTSTLQCGTVEITTIVHQNSPLVDAGPDQNLCGTTTATVIGSTVTPTISGYTYTWFPTSFSLSNTRSVSISTANISSTTYFTLAATYAGCTFSDQVLVYAGYTPDLMIRDSYHDVGKEPNVHTEILDNDIWPCSPAIWPSTTLTPLAYSTPTSGVPHQFNVEIINRSCADIGAYDATLTVYFSLAGTGGNFPTTWSVFPCSSLNSTACTNSSLMCGGQFYTNTVSQPIAPMSKVIESFLWTPVAITTGTALGISQYSCTGIPTNTSVTYCHLAVVDAPSDVLTLPLNDTWVAGLVKDNNNLAWVNLTILKGANDDNLIAQGGILINHYSPPSLVDLEFNTYNIVPEYMNPSYGNDGASGIVINPENNNPFDWTEIQLKFTRGLMQMWEQGGSQGEGVVRINDTIVQLLTSNSAMRNISMEQNQHFPMEVILSPIQIPDTLDGRYFGLHLKQSDATGPPTGAYSYLIDKRGWVCSECDNGDSEMMSGQMMSSRMITSDSLYVSDTLIIGNGITLALEKVKVFFGDRALIKVLQGGKLIVNNSQMINACTNNKWSGIEVIGTSAAVNCLTITNSFFKNTDTPVKLEKAEGILIANSTFLGTHEGTAIKMEKGKDFNFHDNTFTRFEKGIETKKSKSNDNYSVIEKNIFTEMKTAIKFFGDNHADLQLNCNRFEYKDYAIQSDSTTLSNIGSSAMGAGNVFITNSSLANNKLKHVNGNSPTYYYSPAATISGGMNVSILASQASFSCYPAPDTSSSARGVNTTNLKKEIDNKQLSLFAIPNPNDGRAAIHYGLGTEGTGVITVRDAQGRLIDRRKVFSSEEKIEINYRGYASGIYFISLITEGQSMLHRKMVITE